MTMVSQVQYEKVTAAEWQKFKVRTLCVLRSGMMEIPVGTVCQVHGKGGGFTLKTEPCKCCGVSIFIRKVPPGDVAIAGVRPE